MAVFFMRRGGIPVIAPPIGTTWLFEQNGTFEVPATGNYEVELHGGGGGAGKNGPYYSYASGSGSGNLFTVKLNKGDLIEVKIGNGGSGDPNTGNSEDGEASYFGDLTVAGGGGVYCYSYDATIRNPAGNLATAGQFMSSVPQDPTEHWDGGYGNKNKPDQKYGNGGRFNYYVAENGYNGAAIVKFLG